MARLTDEQLVAAAQGGDRNALDQLLRRHYDRIYAVCRRVVGSSRDADDACQEALIKITRSLPRFDGRSSFATWAYRVATNASLDELRKRKRRPMLHTVTDEDATTPEAVDPLASRRVDAVDDRLAIDEALDELSEDFRTAVVLRDVGDLDYVEIAAILDIPVGTVKSRIARGRATVADRLRMNHLLGGSAPLDPALPDRTAALDSDFFDLDGNHTTSHERPRDTRLTDPDDR